MSDDGHKYRYGPPKGAGWPIFDKDGKIIREKEEESETVPGRKDEGA